MLLPAEDIWSGAGENFAYLQYRLPHLQHRLLSDLGYAARIFPPIAASLTEPCPAGCTLTVEEAYEFLGKAAGNLQKAGIRVIVPNW